MSYNLHQVEESSIVSEMLIEGASLAVRAHSATLARLA